MKDGVNLSGHSPHMTSPAQLHASVLLTKVDQTRTYLAERDERPVVAQAAFEAPVQSAPAAAPVAYQPPPQATPILAPYPSIRSVPTAAAYDLRGMETLSSPGG
jgi:hypothetical protein